MENHDWKIAGLETHYGIVAGGKLLGPQMQPRDIAAGLHAAGFVIVKDLSDGCKVCLSESQGYERAYNDNLNAEGVVTSRDVGLMEINIPAVDIGTPVEEALYDPATNFARAFHLFSNRGWEPWVGYTSNVYLRDTYLKRANRGLANWLASLDLAKTPTDTLSGSPYVHNLTNPVFDFEYRVQGMNEALTAANHFAHHKPVSLDELEGAIARGLAAAKS